jgi:hypothetical protein
MDQSIIRPYHVLQKPCFQITTELSCMQRLDAVLMHAVMWYLVRKQLTVL